MVKWLGRGRNDEAILCLVVDYYWLLNVCVMSNSLVHTAGYSWEIKSHGEKEPADAGLNG